MQGKLGRYGHCVSSSFQDPQTEGNAFNKADKHAILKPVYPINKLRLINLHI